MLGQGEPPTRVFPLPLLGKGIHPFLRFRKEKREFRSLIRIFYIKTIPSGAEQPNNSDNHRVWDRHCRCGERQGFRPLTPQAF